MLEPELETVTSELADGSFIDVHGFTAPRPAGTGPRREPRGEFPTGPSVGEVLPDVVAPDSAGRIVDVHELRAGRPAVVVFYRSAVW